MTWNSAKSEELYNIAAWGDGYFRIGKNGHVMVHQDGGTEECQPPIDLHELLAQIQRRGIEAPVLLRFDGILRSRLRNLVGAFQTASTEYEYDGNYRAVFPIKVNQERHVVEALLAEGRHSGLGLEVGSKPELLAVLSLQQGDDPLVICNGYKDAEYVELALLSRRLGLTPVLVVEKFSELEMILRASKRLDIRPVIGVRCKLTARGSGRWQDSVGTKSKFGLTIRDLVSLVDRLKSEGMLDCLQLLHFHLGSQITDIRSIKDAMREATRTFLGLAEMGARIDWFDVGGGLGVDYDGSSTRTESSMNYSLQEYANDVVYQLAEACREHDVPPPTIVSESGRALSAHHAVLITEVLGVSNQTGVGVPILPEEGDPDVVHDMAETCDTVNAENFQESFHDIQQLREEAKVFFNVGQLSLPERAKVEEFYWRACKKIHGITEKLEYVPDEFAGLERDLADIYYLNFSLFQSLPDSWAIDHLFPVLPIHRLDEEPTRRGILADITCDSDGKVDKFIGLGEPKTTIELHEQRQGEPYYVAFFLVGAYQEILGDMHNLFGDTNVIHVDQDEEGAPELPIVTRGDRVKDVLQYVDYIEGDVLRDLRRNVESALRKGSITLEESALFWKRFESGLYGYTYLVREPETARTKNLTETV